MLSVFLCDPCRIQTCNPHIRSVVLYSVELTDHCFSKATAKVLLFFEMTKFFCKKMVFSLKLHFRLYKILIQTIQIYQLIDYCIDGQTCC